RWGWRPSRRPRSDGRAGLLRMPGPVALAWRHRSGANREGKNGTERSLARCRIEITHPKRSIFAQRLESDAARRNRAFLHLLQQGEREKVHTTWAVWSGAGEAADYQDAPREQAVRSPYRSLITR